MVLSIDPANEDVTEQETTACYRPHPSDLVTQPLSPSRPTSTPKPAAVAPLKASQPPRRFNDQLSFLDDLLEDEDLSIHKKLDKVLENQKVLFKLIADLMKGGREHVGKDFSHRSGDVSHMERKVHVGEDIEGCSVGSQSGVYGDVSNVFGGSSYVVAPEDISNTGANYVPRDQLGGNSQHRAPEDISNVTGETSTGPNYVSGGQLGGNGQHRALEDISNATGGTSTGANYVSGGQLGGNGQHRALEDISNATGGTSTGPNYVSGDQLRGNNLIVSNAVGRTDTGTSYVSYDISGANNQHRALGDISNLVGRANMGTNYVSIDHLGSRETNLSREHSFGEEGGQFMGEALVLKRASCSVGNFAAKFLNVVFKSEELVNRNCTGTRGKMALDPGKMAIIKKYVFKFYPCAPAQEESTWRKCVVAIDEFLRRKKRDGGKERQD